MVKIAKNESDKITFTFTIGGWIGIGTVISVLIAFIINVQVHFTQLDTISKTNTECLKEVKFRLDDNNNFNWAVMKALSENKIDIKYTGTSRGQTR